MVTTCHRWGLGIRPGCQNHEHFPYLHDPRHTQRVRHHAQTAQRCGTATHAGSRTTRS